MADPDPLVSFELGFMTGHYLLGQRGDALLNGLPAPHATTRKTHAGFADPDRTVRAKFLATGMAQLRVALDARKLR